MTGINTEVFKAHSNRSASSSKAKITGVFGPRFQNFKDFTGKVSRYMILIFNQESSKTALKRRDRSNDL